MPEKNPRSNPFGWIPSLPDFRDQKFSLRFTLTPSSVNLRPQCPPVFDQGDLGSCTANAAASAYQFDLKRQKKHEFTPSRMFIYYNERALDGTIGADVGSSMRTAIKTMNKTGVCSEQSWNYNMRSWATKPHLKSYIEAAFHRVTSYKALDNTDIVQLKSCLSVGLPFIFGFTVYDSFMTNEMARSGKMPMPKTSERVLGGHAVMCVGYDDEKQMFTVRNSWGTDWADGGYFYMPYAYMTNPNLCMDFWQVTAVTF